MGLFDGANESALAGGRSPRLSDYPGKSILKVVSLTAGLCKGKMRGRTFFAAEVEVVKSTNPAALPGMRLSWAAVKNPEWPDFFFSDVKRLLGALTNRKPEVVKEESMIKAVSEAQPARGLMVQCNCTIAIKDGKNIAVFDWSAGNADTDLGPMLPATGTAPAGGTAPAAGGQIVDAVDDILF